MKKIRIIIFCISSLSLWGQDSGLQPINVIFMVDQSQSMKNNDQAFDAPAGVTNTLNLLNTRASSSLVGFLGFANGLCDGTSDNGGDQRNGAGERFANRVSELNNTQVNPASLNTPGHLDILLSKTDYNEDNYYFNCGSEFFVGTHYFDPFEEALTMLVQAKAQAPQNEEVIIFITDGDPTDEFPGDLVDIASFDSLLVAVEAGATFPTVYAIFIGGTNNKLEQLANVTGGSLVAMESASDISNVMIGILDNTLSIIDPKEFNGPANSFMINNYSDTYLWVIYGKVVWDILGRSHAE